MAAASDKAAGAFRTIGELSRETGLPQHILRYWETRFPQLRPLQRAGNVEHAEHGAAQQRGRGEPEPPARRLQQREQRKPG